MISLNKLVDYISGDDPPSIRWRAGSLFRGVLGYGGAGVGGEVTQATSKVTAFTLNTATGRITFAGGALGAFTSSSATWTCSAIGSNDVVSFVHRTGGSLGAYRIQAVCSAGTAQIVITNTSSAALTEAPVAAYVLHRGAIA